MRRDPLRPAAVFDVDGTLIPQSAERRLVYRLVRRGLVRAGAFSAWLFEGMRNAAGGYGAMFRSNKRLFKGLSLHLVAYEASRCYHEELKPSIPDEARRTIQRHKQAGHLVLLLSGMPEILLREFADDLQVHRHVGTRLEVDDGLFSGTTEGLHPFGPGKRELLDREARLLSIDLPASFGYGNHTSDRFFLEALGNPVAVRPDPGLGRVARTRGWSVIRSWEMWPLTSECASLGACFADPGGQHV